MEKSKLTKWSQYLFSNDENEEDEEENLKSPEIKLIGSILKKLVNALVARKNECLFKEVCVSWEEQIEILQRIIRTKNKQFEACFPMRKSALGTYCFPLPFFPYFIFLSHFCVFLIKNVCLQIFLLLQFTQTVLSLIFTKIMLI
ncbi:SET domain-containing protein [Meloidogyne graminicola]|uniref:SET domain-containing protein n=1 Tax=Meloidogyne graminicola TaxID=189291 RepID=A0A8T0A3P3_9BILA|nr:SET domain-containing protein [Meloidogyne graminicola]